MMKARSSQGQRKVKAMWREGQGKVKARSKKSQAKVKVRLRQRKHNLDLNYNLMGFDTIEINLVYETKSPHFFSLSLFPVEPVCDQRSVAPCYGDSKWLWGLRFRCEPQSIQQVCSVAMGTWTADSVLMSITGRDHFKCYWFYCFRGHTNWYS